jgi:hypothetical protein
MAQEGPSPPLPASAQDGPFPHLPPAREVRANFERRAAASSTASMPIYPYQVDGQGGYPSEYAHASGSGNGIPDYPHVSSDLIPCLSSG